MARMPVPAPALGDSALRIAIVGPTHPAKGGVAAHTTELAHALSDAGHDVVLVSWAQMYPDVLYPGQQRVEGDPEVLPYPRTVPVLRWSRPEGWVRTGRRLREMDLVILVHVIPQMTPAHLAILRAAGADRPGGPRSLLLAHNVLPHESRPGDVPLTRLLLRSTGATLVHSDAQATLAADLGADLVAVADLPPHLPGGAPRPREGKADDPTRLLALGIVRPYKGLDVLLSALAEVPGPTLTIAGEMWGDAGRQVRELAADARLDGRVTLREGYVPADDIAPLLARHDVLALPYRHATASQNALLAHEHGLAVLASTVGTFPDQVRDGVDGLLVPPGDEPALVSALQRLADPRYAARLRDGVEPPDLHGPWATYVGTIEALAAAPPAVPEEATPPVQASAPATSGAAGRLRSRVVDRVRGLTGGSSPRSGGTVRAGGDGLGRSDFPSWVRPTDVLTSEGEAADALAHARSLHLSRGSDPVAAWSALGALAALVRTTDRGNRRPRNAVVLDASGVENPFTAWATIAGFDPVRVEPGAFVDSEGEDDASEGEVDAVVQLFPNDCDAQDVDAFLMAAQWSVRPGGLVVMTLAVGGPHVAGAVAPADVRSVLARADDRSLELVGDLDGDLTSRLRGADLNARTRDAGSSDAAYGLVRLAFRKR